MTRWRALRSWPGGSLTSKPTWSNAYGCSATSAFFCSWLPGSVRLRTLVLSADTRVVTLHERNCDGHQRSSREAGRRVGPDLIFTGEEARHDVRLFVEDLSDAARSRASAAGERVLTIDELAREFRVSTKTVSRWRQQGLVSRRFLFDGRKRLGFLQSSVDRFVAQNAEQVHRATRFSQMTDEERSRLSSERSVWPWRVAVPRRSPSGLPKRRAEVRRRSGLRCGDSTGSILTWRSSRTVTDHCGQRRGCRFSSSIAAANRWQALAQRFSQTPTNIYRIINAMRAAHIMELPLDYIGNEQFARLLVAEEGGRDPGAAAGERSADEEAAVAQRMCPRIWPACTRCPC